MWTGRTFGQRQRCVDGALSVSAARRRRRRGGGGGGGGAQTRTTAAGDQLHSVGRHAHDPTPRRLRHVQTVVDGTHDHVRRTATHTHTQTARSQLTRQQASQSLLSTQARRQEMKWGCFFCKNVENGGGCFFCKKSGPFLNAGCIMYSISILFYILLIGGGRAYAPDAPLRAWNLCKCAAAQRRLGCCEARSAIYRLTTALDDCVMASSCSSRDCMPRPLR